MHLCAARHHHPYARPTSRPARKPHLDFFSRIKTKDEKHRQVHASTIPARTFYPCSIDGCQCPVSAELLTTKHKQQLDRRWSGGALVLVGVALQSRRTDGRPAPRSASACARSRPFLPAAHDVVLCCRLPRNDEASRAALAHVPFRRDFSLRRTGGSWIGGGKSPVQKTGGNCRLKGSETTTTKQVVNSRGCVRL